MRSHLGRHEHGFDHPQRAFRRGFPPQPPLPPGEPFGSWPGAGPGFAPPPGWGPGPRGRGRGGGRRGRRGDVRAAILALLAVRPMHGYEMIQEIGQRSRGYWRPSPGSVYPTLQLLADEGLVASSEGSGSKRLFELTDEGRASVEQLDETPPWEQISHDVDPNDVNLRSAVGQFLGAAHQVALAASSRQKARAIDVINEARRELYGILGEVEPPAAEPDEQDDPDELD